MYCNTLRRYQIATAGSTEATPGFHNATGQVYGSSTFSPISCVVCGTVMMETFWKTSYSVNLWKEE
jgi:hypothetical protein